MLFIEKIIPLITIAHKKILLSTEITFVLCKVIVIKAKNSNQLYKDPRIAKSPKIEHIPIMLNITTIIINNP